MNDRHFPGWVPWVLAALVSIGVGVAAYNAGVTHGLAANPNAAGFATAWGMGWRPWFHPFGFVFPLFFLFFWIFVARALFWRGGWHRYGPGYNGWPDRFDQWHREAHERMNRASSSGPSPADVR